MARRDHSGATVGNSRNRGAGVHVEEIEKSTKAKETAQTVRPCLKANGRDESGARRIPDGNGPR
jgi:hypothetical protein